MNNGVYVHTRLSLICIFDKLKLISSSLNTHLPKWSFYSHSIHYIYPCFINENPWASWAEFLQRQIAYLESWDTEITFLFMSTMSVLRPLSQSLQLSEKFQNTPATLYFPLVTQLIAPWMTQSFAAQFNLNVVQCCRNVTGYCVTFNPLYFWNRWKRKMPMQCCG